MLCTGGSTVGLYLEKPYSAYDVAHYKMSRKHSVFRLLSRRHKYYLQCSARFDPGFFWQKLQQMLYMFMRFVFFQYVISNVSHYQCTESAFMVITGELLNSTAGEAPLILFYAYKCKTSCQPGVGELVLNTPTDRNDKVTQCGTQRV